MKFFKITTLFLVLTISFIGVVFSFEDAKSGIKFSPLNHATLVIQADGVTIYVDPVGEASAFSELPNPDIILITDIHGDHLNPEFVGTLREDNTTVVGPREVIDQLGFGQVLNNEESGVYKTVDIEAIPMYNLAKDRLKFHPKGRGNGYVITLNGKRIYISGDTEDIKEMRSLNDIDYAFVCMNLPYTMSVEQAASAVLGFKPKVVFPYHFRGKGMVSDVEEFKKLVSSDKNIEVRILNWYPQ